ncbi:hypothetical protein PUN28_008309 [Cardiocondyla obscurior]|uniref:Uncharacterized protein n=1 Tax=Cardiocondyla obscurior TaxID=286306 RepID=A0AAW2FZG5_9HYME
MWRVAHFPGLNRNPAADAFSSATASSRCIPSGVSDTSAMSSAYARVLMHGRLQARRRASGWCRREQEDANCLNPRGHLSCTSVLYWRSSMPRVPPRVVGMR